MRSSRRNALIDGSNSNTSSLDFLTKLINNSFVLIGI